MTSPTPPLSSPSSASVPSAPAGRATNVVGFMSINHPDKTITSAKFVFDENPGDPDLPNMTKTQEAYTFKGKWIIQTDKGPVTKEETLTVRVPDDPFGSPRTEEQKIMTALLMVKTYRSQMKSKLKDASLSNGDRKTLGEATQLRSQAFDTKDPKMTLSSADHKVSLQKNFSVDSKKGSPGSKQSKLERVQAQVRALVGGKLPSLTLSGGPATASTPSSSTPAAPLPSSPSIFPLTSPPSPPPSPAQTNVGLSPPPNVGLSPPSPGTLSTGGQPSPPRSTRRPAPPSRRQATPSRPSTPPAGSPRSSVAIPPPPQSAPPPAPSASPPPPVVLSAPSDLPPFPSTAPPPEPSKEPPPLTPESDPRISPFEENA